jgi:subtilase family serine protease
VNLEVARSKAVVVASLGAALLLAFVPTRLLFPRPALSDRILQPIDNAQVTPLKGNVHPFARLEYDRGKVEDSVRLQHMTLMLKPSAGQLASLKTLLPQLQDFSSPYYHQWLTPEQYADRFGVSENDLNKVVSWLQDQGFTVQGTARSRAWVAFSGNAGQVQAAFGTEIHNYVRGGMAYYANASEPSVPTALAGVVLSIRSLHNIRPRPRTIVRRIAGAQPKFTSSTTGLHFITPNDFATIYNVAPLYSNGLDGSGVSIAVMGQTDINTADITAFRKASGLPSATVNTVLVPGSADPGTVKDDLGEADLDVEWAGAVATNASVIYVNSANGAFDSLTYAVDQAIAPIVSISYGDCEQDFGQNDLIALAALGQQANSQGMTIVGPSGDDGAADCDFPATPQAVVNVATHGLAVDAPGSLPYVTSIGGTQFNEGSGNYWNSTNNSSNGSALSYIPETVWNETSAASGLAGSGGGASQSFAKPAWQTGSGVPNDNARDVPDVSVSAAFDHDGYLICSGGDCVNGFRATDGTLDVVGGTSVAPPTFAGILALIIQETNSNQGNVNYVLYPLAAASSDAFHDITTGNNQVPCQAGTADCPNGGMIGYNATEGYDLATGLGSINAFNLVTEWTQFSPTGGVGADFQLSISPGTMTLGAGNSGTATLKLNPINGFTAAVNLTCSVPSTLSGTTCGVNPASLTGNGTTTVTIATQAKSSAPFMFSSFGSFGPLSAFLVLALGSLLGLSYILKRTLPWMVYRHRISWGATLGLILVCVLGFGISCGGGGASSGSTTGSGSSVSTAPVTANVTVQGVSGNTSHSVRIKVTVN